ncbi:MAG: hypothetical protein CMJ83_03420 [Planctomycetes bacterium]|nr:hypothetical protein [Planctomycetota bacterium]
MYGLGGSGGGGGGGSGGGGGDSEAGRDVALSTEKDEAEILDGRTRGEAGSVVLDRTDRGPERTSPADPPRGVSDLLSQSRSVGINVDPSGFGSGVGGFDGELGDLRNHAFSVEHADRARLLQSVQTKPPQVTVELRALLGAVTIAPTPKAREALESFHTDSGYLRGLSVDELKLEASEINRWLDVSARGPGAESYDTIVENPFQLPTKVPLSTFSIDVDTASYANVRRFLTRSTLPPKNAVRIEELVNYFSYDDPAPQAGSEHPFRVTTEVSRCLWNLDHRIVRIGFRAKDIPKQERPASNLVFLIDVSGSMSDQNKLPLLKKCMQALVKTLDENDRVAIVVYASASGLVLDSTNCSNQDDILKALGSLSAGGSTNGGEGIQLAYQKAVENFIPKGTNRVVLCTDGDFNVGVTDRGQLEELIQDRAKTGVYLSVLGFGSGNLKDATMEQLADKGNGNYSYIDGYDEGHKVLVREMTGTLLTVAKDVKLQVEFNPGKVAAWRLLGYENRVLAAQDFNNDKKDAGELGAGHTICALYEIVPAGTDAEVPGIDPLKYQNNPGLSQAALTDELLTVKIRYKKLEDTFSVRFDLPVKSSDRSFDAASIDLRFASAVCAFGLLLRDSAYKGSATWEGILEVAKGAKGEDTHGDRQGFLDLVGKAMGLIKR